MASSLVRWLAGLDVDRLAGLLARRPEGLAAPYPSNLRELAARLQDGRHVTAAVRELPLPAVQLLQALRSHASTAPTRAALAGAVGREQSDPELDATLAVLTQRALVWPDDGTLRVPGALWPALAPRPARAGEPMPFDPRPPAVPAVDAPAGPVAAQTAAAAVGAVSQLSALLELCEQAPARLRKAGGVAVREIRRLAVALVCDEPAVRLWLELAYADELLATHGEQLTPTEEYDHWLAREPAERLACMLTAWLGLRAAPCAPPVDGGPAVAVLPWDPAGATALELRAALLWAAAALPEGTGAAGPEPLADALRWQAPLARQDAELTDAVAASVWQEAHLLGVLAHGALSPLGKALLAADRVALVATARDLLPEPTQEALFQADLTAVVPGLPDQKLAALLDAAGERESGGGATTWRFGEASVRDALDAGHTVTGLLAALRSAAAGHPLPQVLEYLVTDVGRRHGQVRVRQVGCLLHAADPALVTEICQARALRPLGLSAIAPTVLASARPAAETLAALRAAGYAPVGEDAAGQPRVERAARSRVPAEPRFTPRQGWALTRGGPAAEPHVLAQALLAGSAGPGRPARPTRQGRATRLGRVLRPSVVLQPIQAARPGRRPAGRGGAAAPATAGPGAAARRSRR